MIHVSVVKNIDFLVHNDTDIKHFQYLLSTVSMHQYQLRFLALSSVRQRVDTHLPLIHSSHSLWLNNVGVTESEFQCGIAGIAHYLTHSRRFRTHTQSVHTYSRLSNSFHVPKISYFPWLIALK